MGFGQEEPCEHVGVGARCNVPLQKLILHIDIDNPENIQPSDGSWHAMTLLTG